MSQPPPPSPGASGSAAASGSSSSAAAAAAAAPPPKPAPAPLRPIPSALRPLRYMGVPASVLRWQPKLPSRNWLIFLSTSATLTTLYVYDRREAKVARAELVEQVRHLREQPLAPAEWPRKVHVLCAKCPGDDDYEKSVIWFKKYVKPILVAAAVDYEITNGTRFGGLGREVRERIFARRRQLLGLEAWGTQPSGPGASPSDPPAQAQLLQHTPFALTPQAALQRELDGGIILVGRPAYKEYMWGLQQGWSRALPPRREDTDEPLARLLAEDSAFDEVVPKKEDGEELFGDAVPGEDAASRAAAAAASVADDEWQGEADGAGAPLPSRLGKGSLGVSSYLSSPVSPAGRKPPPAEAAPSVAPELLAPPAQIPAQPPLVFADYVNLVGLRYMPRRLVGFFNERAKVRAGGEVALQLALGTVQTAREFDAPAQPRDGPPPQGGDLDWGLRSDDFILPRFRKTQKLVEKQRKEFYDGLPRRLQDTRSLVRGEREATKMETNDPPKSEAELREERFRKEREWRNTLEAYEVLRTEQGVAWSEAFRGALRVFERPAAGEELRQ